MPIIRHILETSLYVADLDRSELFYRGIFDTKTILADDRMRALRLGKDGGVLLLFAKGKSSDGEQTPRGRIPGHDGGGRLHLAFAMAEDDVEAWRAKLAEQGVEIISEVRPEQGGISLYFNDPDGHVIELATPSIWNI